VLTSVVVLLAASLVAVRTVGAPRDPTGAAPTIRAVTSLVSCGSDVVVPQPVSTMRTVLRTAPRIAGESWPDWPPTRAGIEASPGFVRLDVQGVNAAAVTIHDIRVRVVARRPATTGTLVGRACGDAGAYRMLDVDLDRDPPTARSFVEDGVSLEDVRAGGEPDWSVAPIKFPYHVSLSEPESFVIYGNTASSDVSWVIDLDWASGREQGTATIDDDGTPFRTMGRASIPSSCTQINEVWRCS
jgi:hypothetical protein